MSNSNGRNENQKEKKKIEAKTCTVEGYREALERIKSDISRGISRSFSDYDTSEKGHNPPEDGLTLEEIAKSRDYKMQICDIYKKMCQVDNKSNLLVMYANGYAFTWSALKTIYDFVSITSHDDEQDDGKDAQICELKKNENESVRKTMTYEKYVYEEYMEISKKYVNKTTVNSFALKFFIEAYKNGKIIFR
ncbi:MAG: hypothetical protein MJ133_07620 [Lachnospiraceae bacterium]|nr:hypothetical protein [Lachnospiraceae bacterium]